MDVSPEVASLGVELAKTVAQNTAAAVNAKIRTLREAKQSDETISGLEAIVNELIDDRAKLARIAQAYQQELVAQRLAPGDVKYIADTVFPLLEQLVTSQDVVSTSDDEPDSNRAMLETLKPLLSDKTVNVLQMLGYDFRAGIGAPLTQLTANLILSRAEATDQIALAQLRREQLYLEVALDPAATERLQVILGR
jgi:hypothetical protein